MRSLYNDNSVAARFGKPRFGISLKQCKSRSRALCSHVVTLYLIRFCWTSFSKIVWKSDWLIKSLVETVCYTFGSNKVNPKTQKNLVIVKIKNADDLFPSFTGISRKTSTST